MGNGRWTRVSSALRTELQQLTHIHSSNRPWEMPLAAAVATGVPLLAGASIGRMDFGLVATLGGLAFLSLPDTRMQHRMMLTMAVAFGMIVCYALGALTHFFPPAMIATLTLISVVASMTARYYRLGPPGILFLVMAASIAAYTPATLLDIPLRIGLITLGAVFACIVAFAYSLHRVRRVPPASAVPEPGMDFDYVVVDSVIIGSCIGLSLLLAQLLQLQRPYWVPVSCLAIIQGASLRMVWNRHAQRVLGTVAGLGLAWLLLELPLNTWGVVAVMITLSFVIETLVVRHYGLAVIFITPLTIFLAEAGQLGQQSPLATMQARVLDIVIGSLVGLAGGAALHAPAFRSQVARAIRALLPSRV
ncbi:FUSC family protein [Povalibacter sp.]|uniref:FUSC family protein n=1 Tax=Povalibacter sp. TaxID=1962978 RepID=UPI002F40BB61